VRVAAVTPRERDTSSGSSPRSSRSTAVVLRCRDLLPPHPGDAAADWWSLRVARPRFDVRALIHDPPLSRQSSAYEVSQSTVGRETSPRLAHRKCPVERLIFLGSDAVLRQKFIFNSRIPADKIEDGANVLRRIIKSRNDRRPDADSQIREGVRHTSEVVENKGVVHPGECLVLDGTAAPSARVVRSGVRADGCILLIPAGARLLVGPSTKGDHHVATT